MRKNGAMSGPNSVINFLKAGINVQIDHAFSTLFEFTYEHYSAE